MISTLALFPARFRETYLVIRAPVGSIHGYMALKEDEDDIGHRIYCEYQSSRAGRRFLLFSYLRDEKIDSWTYILGEENASLQEISDLLRDLNVNLDLVESARDEDGRLFVDLERLREMHHRQTHQMNGSSI